MHSITRRIRARRDRAAFDRALRNAGPTMRLELTAAAARSQSQLRGHSGF
jgi:hypothetical protein